MKYVKQRMSMRSANARYSADPDDANAEIVLIGMPWLMIGEEPSAVPNECRTPASKATATFRYEDRRLRDIRARRLLRRVVLKDKSRTTLLAKDMSFENLQPS
jgi:hypothetical protein